MKSAYFFVSFFSVLTFLRPQEFLSWITLPILSIAMVIAFVSWLGIKDKNLSTPIQKYIVLFFIVVAVSCFLNKPSLALNRSWDFLFNIILPTIILTNVLTSVDKQKHLMFWLTVVGGFVAYHSIDQFLSETQQGWTGLKAIYAKDKKVWQIIWFGILGDPNDLGQFFLVIIPFTIFLLTQTSSIFVKLISFANFGLILGACFLTNSRGTMLGLIAMVGLWVVRKFGVFKTCAVAVVAIPVLMIALSGVGQFDGQDKSANQRLDAWIQGWLMLRSSIFFGVGKGGFAENHNKTAHNSLVLTYAETGLTGYLMWAFMLIACFLWLWSLSSGKIFSGTSNNLYKKIEIERPLATSLLYSLCGFLGSAFFISRCYAFVLFLIVGFTTAQIIRFEKLMPDYKFKFKWQLFAPLVIASIAVITVVSLKMK